MDADWARALLDRVCDELATQRRRAGRALAPLSVGAVMALGVGGSLSCEAQDAYGGPPPGWEAPDVDADADADEITATDAGEDGPAADAAETAD